jgi:hypothetical protein
VLQGLFVGVNSLSPELPIYELIDKATWCGIRYLCSYQLTLYKLLQQLTLDLLLLTPLYIVLFISTQITPFVVLNPNLDDVEEKGMFQGNLLVASKENVMEPSTVERSGTELSLTINKIM